MNSANNSTLWDSLPEYKRRNPKSVKYPSERIDPDLPGAHFWVIIATNWQNLHPLVQDVLYEWYYGLSNTKNNVEELDPKSTEALVNRLGELDEKLHSFGLERTNLEQELHIRDRDFRRLRSMTGKKEKENIEVQHQLGRSFQDKIIQKQVELEEKNELIRDLEARIALTENGEQNANSNATQANIQKLSNILEEKINRLQELSEKVEHLNTTINEQDETISKLKKEIKVKNEKLKEIKGLLKL
ncbi:MAG: hypothetical protein ACTSPM_01845 [Candidatus Heimdallarchaeota archaeon]